MNDRGASWSEIASAHVARTDGTPRRRVAILLAGMAARFWKLVSRRSPARGRWLRDYHATRRRLVLHDLPPRRIEANAGPRMLLVNPDFSGGGAPQLLFELARVFVDRGYRLMLLTAEDGPLRERFVAAGIPVLIDPLVRHVQPRSIVALAAAADVSVANTVLSLHAVQGLAPHVPCFWYIHEVSIFDEVLAEEPTLPEMLTMPTAVWAGSELSAALIRPFRADVAVVPYGLDPVPADGLAARAAEEPFRIALLASVEPRKGQDLAVAALALLPEAERRAVRLLIHGRVTDDAFAAELGQAAATIPEVTIGGSLSTQGYRDALAACDGVLLASRDDTLPLVSLDALGAGRILLCTPTTGTSAYLSDGVDGFVSDAADAPSIAAMLSRALAQRDRWPAIAAAGREVFERHFSRDSFSARVGDAVKAAVVGIGAAS